MLNFLKQLTEGFKNVFRAYQIISRVTEKQFSTHLKTQKTAMKHLC